MSESQMPARKATTSAACSSAEVGQFGEALTAQWLRSQGWEILHYRWHCRFGELDLVAHQQSSPTHSAYSTLAFVEVKTRSRGNWDANGVLAVTKGKQAKLWKTAQLFLAAYPALADATCRFDVALVICQLVQTTPALTVTDVAAMPEIPIHLGQPVLVSGYRLTLQDYLPAAFEQ